MQLKTCLVKDFYKLTEGKTVICFGVGNLLKSLDFRVRCDHIFPAEKIIFVDSEETKQGKIFSLWNQKFTIQSPEIIKEYQNVDCILLVTCGAANAYSIFLQMKQMGRFDYMDFYVFEVMCRTRNPDLELFFEEYAVNNRIQNRKELLSGLNLKNKYKGKRCFVIGNGPSLRTDDLERLKDEVTFAVNGIYNIYPYTQWRPTYYVCCDTVTLNYKAVARMHLDGTTAFLSLCSACIDCVILNNGYYYDTLPLETQYKENGLVANRTLLFSKNIIDGIYTSSAPVIYQVLQFVAYMGFESVYLIGVDNNFTMCQIAKDIPHFSKNYNDYLMSDGAIPFSIMDSSARKKSLDEIYMFAFYSLKEMGIKLLNATRGGCLDVLPRICLDSVL